jgi:hypothetical protein
MTDGYPPPSPYRWPSPPYEWHPGPPSLRPQLGRLAAAVGAAVLYIAIWVAVFPHLGSSGPEWAGFFEILGLFYGVQLLGSLGAWAYESAYPLPVPKFGISPLGVYVGDRWNRREVPWTHAALLGNQLILLPPRQNRLRWLWTSWWTESASRIRVFSLTDQQSQRARALRPAGL